MSCILKTGIIENNVNLRYNHNWGDNMAKNKGGRPLKEIDKKSFEELCKLQCTQSEICSFFNITDKTLNNWCVRTYGERFSEVFSHYKEERKIALRRVQWRQAQNNVKMSIWLGKNWLGQRDVVETHDGTNESEIEKLARQLLGGEEKKDD